MNPMNWVRGCHKPALSGAKASLNGYIGVFAPMLSLTCIYRSGSRWLCNRVCPKSHEINDKVIVNSPTTSLLVVFLLFAPNGGKGPRQWCGGYPQNGEKGI